MDQTHIGYTSWQDPPQNVMPKVTEIEVPAEAQIGSDSRRDGFGMARRSRRS